MTLKRNASRKKTLTAKKSKTKSSPRAAKSFSAGLQKSVDSALLILPPKVQANIDQVLKSIDVSPLRLQDLRTLGLRVLKHATEISESLKNASLVSKKSVRGKKK
jgi:hypothetical protein